MANLPLYLDVAARALVKAPSSTIPAQLPVFYRGDKLGIDLYFLQPTGNQFAPYQFVDFSSPTIKLGIGAIGGTPIETTSWSAHSSGASGSVSGTQNGNSAAVTATVTSLQDGNGTSLNEIQKIAFSAKPTSGYFVLQIPGASDYVYSGAIPFTATAVELQTAITATGTGAILAGYFPGESFIIEWPKTDYTNYAATSVTLSSDAVGGTLHEVQKVSFTAPPLAGTFTLTFTEGTTSPIDFDATADAIAAVINDLLGDGAVSVTGSAQTFFVITWADYVNHATATLDTSLLLWSTGYSATLNLDATDVDALLGGADSITNAICEIEVTVSSNPETLFHTTCTVAKDLIV